MAKKTNVIINGNSYYQIKRKIGKHLNELGNWVTDFKHFYGTSKKEALEKFDEYMNTSADAINSCLGELIEEWNDTFFINCELSENTKSLYIGAYNRTFRNSSICGKIVNEVSAADLQSFFNSSDAPIGTKKALCNYLKRFFKYTAINEICPNLMVNVSVGGVSSAPGTQNSDIDFSNKIWNDADLKKVISALYGHKFRFLVVLAVNSGARFSELLALEYNDIKGGCLYINKQVSESALNGKSVPHIVPTKTSTSNRVIPLSDYVLSELEEHKKIHHQEMIDNNYDTNIIFSSAVGGYLYRRNVIKVLERVYKSCGVPYRNFHAFRHTFGTNLSRAGVPIEDTASLMGHSNINVTNRYYIFVDANRKRDAVNKISAFSMLD